MGNVGERPLVEKLDDTLEEAKAKTLRYTGRCEGSEAVVDTAIDKLSKAKHKTLVHTIC